MGNGDRRPAALRGVRVLLTRPAEDSAPLAEAIEALGGEAIIAPMIRIGPPADGNALEDARLRIGEADWIALTSRHGATALLAKIPPPERRPRIAVVGASTAERVRRHGWPVDREAAGRGAADLAERLVSERIGGATVFYPRSDRADDRFERRLTGAGARVVAFEAYRTGPPGPEERAALLALHGTPDVIVFGSPSAVRNLADLLARENGPFEPNRPKAVAIGRTTAAALDRHGFGTIVEAERPDTEGLVDAVLRARAQS